MTVGQKLHQTLASLESAVGTLKGFSLDTQDKNAKQQFEWVRSTIGSNCTRTERSYQLRGNQEPSYKCLHKLNRTSLQAAVWSKQRA